MNGLRSLAQVGTSAKPASKAVILLTAVLVIGGNLGASAAALGGSSGAALGVAAPVQQADAATAPSPPGELSEPEGGIDWNGNFFGPCRGDCAISVYGGQEVTTSMERMFFVKYPPRPFWKWQWSNSEIIAGTFSRRLVTFWNSLSLEPEFGVGQRFGGMHATEFWGAFNVRWINFPWNRYIKTTVGIAEGISLTTQVDTSERLLNNSTVVGNQRVFRGSDLLNFFTPEITFALPQYAAYEIILRFQHRSGMFGSINGVHAGAQFLTAGLRVHF